MKLSKIFALLLALCLISSAACAATFTDAHGNVIELDDSLEAYAAVTLVGADNAARQGETNLGDLWADALRWFAVSGEINAAFDEDDVKACLLYTSIVIGVRRLKDAAIELYHFLNDDEAEEAPAA